MRVAILWIAALTAGAVVSHGADDDLAVVLLAAKTPDERAALLRGRDKAELAAALDAVERSGDAGYTAKDYAKSLNAYQTALVLARKIGADTKLPFYFRRIGLSYSLQGQGDEALAAYREGVTVSEKANDSVMLAENLHGVANNLQRRGQFRDALPFSERELALVEKAGQPEAMVRALSTYAEALSGLGRLKQALPLADRAVEVSRHSSRPDDYPACLSNLAIYTADLGDFDAALRILRSLPTPGPASLNSIAIIEVQLHRESDAETDYRAAIAASTAPGLWRVRATVLINLGILHHRQGKLAESQTELEQALAVSQAHQDRQGMAAEQTELAEIAADGNKPKEAMDKARAALSLAREAEDPARITDALVAQAHAFEVAGRNEEAGRTAAEAIAAAEGLRADAPASAAGLQGEVGQWMPTYQYAVGRELRGGTALEALRLADRAKARVLLDMLDGGQPGFDALADPRERAEEQQVRDQVSRARRVALTKPAPAAKASLETALRQEEDFDLRLYLRHPELVLQRAAAPDLRPEDLAALAPDGRTALLSYFMLRDSVALFVVRAGARPGSPVVRVFTLPGGDKLNARIASFRSQIAARDLDYRVSAKALYGALLAPAAAELHGADRWILSPDGALWDVPFQALMDGQGKHVLETHSISYAPSLAVLRELRERPAAAGTPGMALLVVANPSVTGVASIPDAEREAGAIAALYGSSHATLLSRDRATAGLFRESAGGAGVIHIAAHAETETNHPLESFLLLAPPPRTAGKDGSTDDGALTARDLLGMRLRARLVVLSACETARGKIGQGDGVMGLGWAVLAAGARASVLSQWKVDSGATSDLMIDFHRRLTGGTASDKAEALRQASLDTMRSPGRLHPFYWAAFIMVGDAR